ncbi:hypothetical protein L873DRAFT_1922228 [Choiromyces venosus 120613-1]|uniref:Uncharacterized protein n=1 Tax=Choiromyces venosus 120613-1 TaxID=1336337 RepID=A0A3N4K6I9_9PEZI|nr:hypothetical protein L873DRAFT_1922228 [Choiromyces venosus 120613-1]
MQYPDTSNRSTQQQIWLFVEEWPKQLDMNSDALGLCKDVLVKALSPDEDVPDADLWSSVYRLLETLHFSYLDLQVISINPYQDFLITYRHRIRITHPEFFIRTSSHVMGRLGSRDRTRVLSSLLDVAVQEGKFNNMFFVFLEQLALTEVSEELRHPIGTNTSVRQRIILFAREWPHPLAPNGDTLALCKEILLKALALQLDKEFWYCMYKLLDSFYFSETEIDIINESSFEDFRNTYRLSLAENTEFTIEMLETPDIIRSMLKRATVDDSSACRELFLNFLHKLALTDACRELRHPIGSETSVEQRLVLLADEWPRLLVINDKILDLCTDVMFKAINTEADVSDKELLYSLYYLLNALHFSKLDLQVIRETPLRNFRSTYRQFFLDMSLFTIDEVQENPEVLRYMLAGARSEGHGLQLIPLHMRSRMQAQDSPEFFRVLLFQLALTDVSGELKHPIGSETTVGKRILLFAEEWPNQLDLAPDVLNLGPEVLSLCTDLVIEALSPEDEISDTEFWYSLYHLLNAFPAVETARANRNIARMVRDYAFKYAREHPYLLALNVGLTVVGFAVPPLLGVLGFGRAGVAAGSFPRDFVRESDGWKVSH